MGATNPNRVEIEQKRKVIRNHMRAILREVEREDSWANADGLMDQAYKIVEESKKVFPKDDISCFTMPIDYIHVGFAPELSSVKNKAMQRVVEVRMALNGLLEYYDSMLGDPISQEFIDSSLAQASEALHDEDQKHPTLVASLFIRISIEQTLKTLCNRNQIQYAHGAKARTLSMRLNEEGIIPADISDDIQVKLKFLNAVVHGEADPPTAKVHEVLDWTNRFTSAYLPGPLIQDIS